MNIIDKFLCIMLLFVALLVAGGVTSYAIIENNNEAKVYDLMSQRGYEQVTVQGYGSWVWQKADIKIMFEIPQKEEINEENIY